MEYALLAQLDRADGFYPSGQGFESSTARHYKKVVPTMETLTYFKEIEIETKTQDVLNQLRSRMVNASSGVPIQTGQQLPRRRVLHNMENKNWEIVEKSDNTVWVRFYDDLTYAEFMLLC